VEIEAKFLLKNPVVFKKKLLKLGAKRIGLHKEKNLLFDHSNSNTAINFLHKLSGKKIFFPSKSKGKSLSELNYLVRLRVVEGMRGKKFFLTIKEPRITSFVAGAHVRPEYEIELSKEKELLKQLKAKGFFHYFTYHKQRESFEFLGNKVEVDKLKELPGQFFAEVEARSEKELKNILKQLRIRKLINKTYLELIKERKQSIY